MNISPVQSAKFWDTHDFIAVIFFDFLLSHFNLWIIKLSYWLKAREAETSWKAELKGYIDKHNIQSSPIMGCLSPIPKILSLEKKWCGRLCKPVGWDMKDWLKIIYDWRISHIIWYKVVYTLYYSYHVHHLESIGVDRICSHKTIIAHSYTSENNISTTLICHIHEEHAPLDRQYWLSSPDYKLNANKDQLPFYVEQ